MTKILALAFCAVCCSFLHVRSQIPTTTNESVRREFEANRRNEMELEQRMRNLGQLENNVRARDARDRSLLRSYNVVQLSKEERERVLRLRQIDPQDAVRFREFLQAKKTGIFRLFPNFDCVTPTTVKIDGDCAQFVPESYAFSFRVGGYSDSNYHDLMINHGEIFSNAFFAQGIFVPLGDMPLETVTTSHPALTYLKGLLPEPDIPGAKSAAARYEAGHEAGGFTYANRIKPAENVSYGLRIIAYKCGNFFSPPSDKSSLTELKFISLGYDERDDLTVAFRIVRKDPDGSLTILWKELARTDAPKLRFAKGQAPSDFKSVR